MSDSWICVQQFPQRVEAEIAQGLLTTQGIRSFISADDAGGLYALPTQSGFSLVKLLVNQPDLQQAQQILNSV